MTNEVFLQRELDSYVTSPYQFDLDEIIQRDLASYVPSPHSEVGDYTSSPISVSLPTPTLVAPTPRQPQPEHAPIYNRIDTSKVLLLDVDYIEAKEKIRDFEQFLQRIPSHVRHVVEGGTIVMPSRYSDEVYFASLQGIIMTKHRELLERLVLFL